MALRNDRRGGLRLLAVVVVLAIVLAAAVAVAFTTALPDANEASTESLGYFDTKATVSYGFVTGCDQVTGQGCDLSPYRGSVPPKVAFDEHAAQPSGPATVFELPRGSVSQGQTCRGWALMTVTGPGLNNFDAAPKTSDTKTFVFTEPIVFHWGHFYLNEQGEFSITIELYLAGCFLYDGGRVETLYRTLQFDGVNDT